MVLTSAILSVYMEILHVQSRMPGHCLWTLDKIQVQARIRDQ